MGRDGDGDGAVDRGAEISSHLWAGGCFLGNVLNCCTFYICFVLCFISRHLHSAKFACSFDFFFS